MLTENDFRLKYFPEEYDMSQGMRMSGFAPLTEEEIETIKRSIRRIKADESKFIFNHEKHYSRTCYNPMKDVVYVGRNVFPDINSNSIHPRDLMSVACVLAHEYYGHRAFREEYLNDIEEYCVTTPISEDECRASITAAKTCPGLSREERSHLIQEAHMRAKEFGIPLENDNFMKEVLYGYSNEYSYESEKIDYDDNESEYVPESIENSFSDSRNSNRREEDLGMYYNTMPPL